MAHPLVSVVIPVRDEAKETVAALQYTLSQLEVYDFYAHCREVIVVDDGSRIAIPSATIRHETPLGYGAALKSGIQKATGQLILTMDGDGQHSAWDAARLLNFFLYFPENAMVIGDRRLKERGTRLWGRKALNWCASLFAHRWIPDLNSGLRIFRRDVAVGYLPILSDQFSFTTSLTLAMLADGYSVDWLSVKVGIRKQGTTKVRVLQDGWRTLRLILWIGLALNTRTVRRWLRPVITPFRRAFHL